MKILVISQHYWPEPFPLAHICEKLAEMGHTVHVVTDVPNYPMGYIYPEYRSGKNRVQERGGVTIRRTFTIGRRNNILFRMLNYYSYAISSTLYVSRLKEEYDVVFTNQSSPVMMVNAAMTYAKKHGKKCVLYCMDLWPASLAAGGVGEKSPIYRFFHGVSKRLYRKANRILITSQMFRDYFRKEFGIADNIIGYLPQYADATFDIQLPPKADTQTIDFVFAGNIGAAQSLDTVLDAARILKAEAPIRWHIVGDGSELEHLKSRAAELGLENVIFYGRKPLAEMPQYYAKADAMLVTLTADPFIGMTLPAKVQSYMAVGKPILAAANGEIPNVIRDAGCGFCANAGDAEGLAEAVRKFIACSDKTALGKRAKEYYQAHFTQERFMARLVSELEAHL